MSLTPGARCAQASLVVVVPSSLVSVSGVGRCLLVSQVVQASCQLCAADCRSPVWLFPVRGNVLGCEVFSAQGGEKVRTDEAQGWLVVVVVEKCSKGISQDLVVDEDVHLQVVELCSRQQ